MRKITQHIRSIFILLTISITIYACTTTGPLTEKQIIQKNYLEIVSDTSNADLIPDKFAMYPNGLNGIYEHVSKTIKYPSTARQLGIEGRVIVSYIVEVDGTIKEIKFIQRAHPALNKEAIRILLTMDRWIPGYANGKPVRMEYVLPIKFTLE